MTMLYEETAPWNLASTEATSANIYRTQRERYTKSNQIKSNMALIWVGKPQPSIKLNRLIRQKIDILDRQIYNILKCDVNV